MNRCCPYWSSAIPPGPRPVCERGRASKAPCNSSRRPLRGATFRSIRASPSVAQARSARPPKGAVRRILTEDYPIRQRSRRLPGKTPAQSLPLPGEGGAQRRMRSYLLDKVIIGDKCAARWGPSSVTFGDSFPQRGKPFGAARPDCWRIIPGLRKCPPCRIKYSLTGNNVFSVSSRAFREFAAPLFSTGG